MRGMSRVHISRNGNLIGVHAESEIHGLLQDGTVALTDHYWTEGMDSWASVGTRDWPRQESQPSPGFDSKGRWYRLADRELIAGVCSGLAHKFGASDWFVRILFLLALPLGSWFLYLLMWLLFAVERLAPAADSNFDCGSRKPAGFAKFVKLAGFGMIACVLAMVLAAVFVEQPGDVRSEDSRRAAYGYSTDVLSRLLANSAHLLPPEFSDYENGDSIEFESHRDRSTIVVRVTFRESVYPRAGGAPSRLQCSVAYVQSEHRPGREVVYASVGTLLLEGDEESYQDFVSYARRGELDSLAKFAANVKRRR